MANRRAGKVLLQDWPWNPRRFWLELAVLPLGVAAATAGFVILLVVMLSHFWALPRIPVFLIFWTLLVALEASYTTLVLWAYELDEAVRAFEVTAIALPSLVISLVYWMLAPAAPPPASSLQGAPLDVVWEVSIRNVAFLLPLLITGIAWGIGTLCACQVVKMLPDPQRPSTWPTGDVRPEQTDTSTYNKKHEAQLRQAGVFLCRYMLRLLVALIVLTIVANEWSLQTGRGLPSFSRGVALAAGLMGCIGALVVLAAVRMLSLESEWRGRGALLDTGMRRAWLGGVSGLLLLVVAVALMAPRNLSPLASESASFFVQAFHRFMSWFTELVGPGLVQNEPTQGVDILERMISQLIVVGESVTRVVVSGLLRGGGTAFARVNTLLGNVLSIAAVVFAIAIALMLAYRFGRGAFRLPAILAYIYGMVLWLRECIRVGWRALVAYLRGLGRQPVPDEKPEVEVPSLSELLQGLRAALRLDGSSLPKDHALAIRALFLRLLILGRKSGRPRRPGQTAAQYLQELGSELGLERSQLGTGVAVYQELRYSRHRPEGQRLVSGYHVFRRMLQAVRYLVFRGAMKRGGASADQGQRRGPKVIRVS